MKMKHNEIDDRYHMHNIPLSKVGGYFSPEQVVYVLTKLLITMTGGLPC